MVLVHTTVNTSSTMSSYKTYDLLDWDAVLFTPALHSSSYPLMLHVYTYSSCHSILLLNTSTWLIRVMIDVTQYCSSNWHEIVFHVPSHMSNVKCSTWSIYLLPVTILYWNSFNASEAIYVSRSELVEIEQCERRELGFRSEGQRSSTKTSGVGNIRYSRLVLFLSSSLLHRIVHTTTRK